MDLHQKLQLARDHHQAGMLQLAESGYREVLTASPGLPIVLHWLALVLQARGELGEAIECWILAIKREPSFAEALSNLGVAYCALGRYEEAEDYGRRAITVRPNDSHACGNLGALMQRQEKYDQAITYYEMALRITPNFVEAIVNLGSVHFARGDAGKAIELYKQAITLQPDHAPSHFYLASALLSRGHFEDGWREYEWRWRMEDFPSPRISLPQPRWDGGDLTGKTLLVYTEQGFGDAIQFVRFVHLVAERCAKVILACPPELARLFSNVRGVAAIATQGEAVPPFDVHCPLLDLPRWLNTTVATIPKDVPYLFPDPSWEEKWKSRIPSGHELLRIGVAWRGKSQRYLPVEAWKELSRLEHVWLCSLQKDASRTETTAIPLANWPEALNDFADTAALIAQLDLVITVDTAIAHLAGAMGKPVWILLRPPVDWRWMHTRTDTPWYPTARLFRVEGNNCDEKIHQMVSDVQALLD